MAEMAPFLRICFLSFNRKFIIGRFDPDLSFQREMVMERERERGRDKEERGGKKRAKRVKEIMDKANEEMRKQLGRQAL